MSYKENRLFVINEPNAPQFSPLLAKEIGLNECLLLRQLEFWISIGNKYKEGKKWTYQSTSDIQKLFVCWSRGTIQATVKSLESQKLITIKTFNVRKNDKTRWFSLNYEELGKLSSITLRNITTSDNLHSEAEQSRSETEQSRSEAEQTLFRNCTTLPEKDNTKTTQRKLDGYSEEDPKKTKRPEDIRELFDKWFKFYPRHEQKEKAYKKFFELGLWNGEYGKLIKATRNFKDRTESYPPDKITMPVNFLMKYEEEL